MTAAADSGKRMDGVSRSTRRFDLDWLRFLAVLLLVLGILPAVFPGHG